MEEARSATCWSCHAKYIGVKSCPCNSFCNFTYDDSMLDEMSVDSDPGERLQNFYNRTDSIDREGMQRIHCHRKVLHFN